MVSAFGKPFKLSPATCAAALFAVLAAGSALPREAEAQSYYYYKNSPGYGYYVQKPRPAKELRPVKRTTKRETVSRSDEKVAEPPAKTTGPLTIVVSIKKQRVNIYDANGLVTEAPISSGRVGYATPTGVFTILEKNKIHYSNLYDSAPMPNMQRITWSGVALHAGDLPGYPASHGCIRLPRGFSSKLFELTRVGQRVIVTGDQPEPQRVSHEKLFAAFPQASQVTTRGALLPGTAKVADASGATTPAETAAAPDLPSATVEAAPSPWRQKWLAEMARRAEAVKTAEETKAKSAGVIADAAKAFEDAKAGLKSARADYDRFAADARKAKEAKAEADRKLAQFAQDRVALAMRVDADKTAEPPADQLQKLSDMEDQLEAATYDRATDAQAAAEDEVRAADAVKEAEAKLSSAVAAQGEAVAAAKKATVDLQAAIASNEAAKRREAKRGQPVSVLVSRKEGKLFVRQGYEPILELPVTIADADKPIGTHVFTALAVKENGKDVDWSVVSISQPSAAQTAEKSEQKGKRKSDDIETASIESAAPVVSAREALDRVTIPDEAREQIEDAMKPGSSLIVSDLGISNETGKFTDFILLTSSSGSGGSKKSSSKRPSSASKPAKKPEQGGGGGGLFYW